MIARIGLQPFASPRARAARLPLLALAGLALLGLSLWDPVEHPGPVLCLSRRAFAVPCPFCGATRGASLCLHGQPAAATVYNPLSLPVVVLGGLLLARWSFEYLTDREVVFAWSPGWRTAACWFVSLAVVAAWVYLLAYRREDEFTRSWLGQAVAAFW